MHTSIKPTVKVVQPLLISGPMATSITQTSGILRSNLIIQLIWVCIAQPLMPTIEDNEGFTFAPWTFLASDY